MNIFYKIYDILVILLPIILLWFLPENVVPAFVEVLLYLYTLIVGIKQGKQFFQS